MPTLTSRIVDSPEKTERFIWDYRRTIAELFAENYYDYFAVLAHQAGLKLEDEPYGNGPYDLECGRSADRIIGGILVSCWYLSHSLRVASSIAHIYGKSVVGAESFTSQDGGWDIEPPNVESPR